MTLIISLFNSKIWPLQNLDDSWRVTEDYPNASRWYLEVQLLCQLRASWLELISKAPGTLIVVDNLMNVFFSICIRNEG